MRMKGSWVMAVVALCLVVGCAHQSTQVSVPANKPDVTQQPTKATTAAQPEIYSGLSWTEQQAVWATWLADMRVVVTTTNNPDDKKILSFIEKNGTLWDGLKGRPQPIKAGYKFYILAFGYQPASQWQADLGLGSFVFAQYNQEITSLIVKIGQMPAKIRGTIGLHEGVHALHWRTIHGMKGLTVEQYYGEELSAYTIQVRQFRTIYYPEYESFRNRLMSLINDDVQLRAQKARTEEESFLAFCPRLDAVKIVLSRPEEIEKAFGVSLGTLTNEDALNYINFSFLDAAFAVLDINFPKKDDGKHMKVAWLQQFQKECE